MSHLFIDLRKEEKIIKKMKRLHGKRLLSQLKIKPYTKEKEYQFKLKNINKNKKQDLNLEKKK